MTKIKKLFPWTVYLFLVLLMMGCGDDADSDAIIVAQEDLTASVLGTVGGSPIPLNTAGPLLFKVQRSSTDTTPVPNIDIQFFSGGSVSPLPTLVSQGILLGEFFETRTDDQGTARVSLQWTVPNCADTTDITTVASVSALISADLKTWDATITTKCGATVSSLNITTTSLPGGTVGTAYSQTVAATGGPTPYTWSVVSGTLPAGLSLNTATGVISGTPTATGSLSFTIRVTDAAAATDDQILSITIS